MKTIVFVLNNIDHAGGTQRVLVNVANRLCRYPAVRVQVVYFTGQNRCSFPLDDAVERVKLECSNRKRWFWTPIRWTSTGFSLRRYLRSLVGPVDVLPIWVDYGAVTAMFCAGLDIRTFACDHMSYPNVGSLPWRILRRFFYRRLTGVVSLTEEDIPNYQRIAKEVVWIPNFLTETPARRAPLRGARMLAIGHCVPRKGFDRLLHGMAKLRQNRSDWSLRIISGGGDSIIDEKYLGHLLDLMRAYRLEDHVEFVPETDAIEAEYLAADLYVMGSHAEGLPMVLLEAKAMGLPIVAYDCATGPRTIVRDGVDGFVVDDARSFALRIEELLSDDERRRAFGIAAQEDFVARFTPDSVVPRWERLLELTPAQSSSPAPAA